MATGGDGVLVRDNREEATAMLTKLALGLGAEPPPARFAMYRRALADLTLAELAQACAHAAGSCRFFPSPSELRAFVQGSEEDAALLAWTTVERACGEAGAWTPVHFADGAIASAVDMVFGGWPEACEVAGTAAFGSRRQEFLAAYRAARRQHAHPRTLPGLAGPPRSPATLVAHVARDGSVVADTPERLLAAGRPVAALPPRRAKALPAPKEQP